MNETVSSTHLPLKPEAVRIGHVNLKVANLDRALAFYEGVLGLKITKRIGDDAAFLAFGGYHHDICINTWQSRNGAPPKPHSTGLFHIAIVYSSRADLTDIFRRLKGANIEIDAAVDHGVSESIYLRDPDQNGVELYWDRPPELWWGAAGELKMGHQPMELDRLTL
jgi:catechol 2,3-dioxygenase